MADRRTANRRYAHRVSPVITSQREQRASPVITSENKRKLSAISRRASPVRTRVSSSSGVPLSECYSFLQINFRSGYVAVSPPVLTSTSEIATSVSRRLFDEIITPRATTASDARTIPRKKKRKSDVYDLSSTSAEETKAYRSPDYAVRRCMARKRTMIRRRRRFPFSKKELQYLESGYKTYNGDFLAILRGFADYFHPSRTSAELRTEWNLLCKRESDLLLQSNKCRWKKSAK